jgi:hypothetical protein
MKSSSFASVNAPAARSRDRAGHRVSVWKNTLHFSISVYPFLLQSCEYFHHAAPQHDVSSPRGVSMPSRASRQRYR